MKTIALSLALLCCLGCHTIKPVATYSPPPPGAGGQVSGRYQLLSGPVFNSHNAMEPSILRIDTATGQTWRFTLTAAPIKNTPGAQSVDVENWFPVSEGYWSTVAYMWSRWSDNTNQAPQLTQHP